MAKSTPARIKTAQIILFPKPFRSPPEPELDFVAEMAALILESMLEAESQARSIPKDATGEKP